MQTMTAMAQSRQAAGGARRERPFVAAVLAGRFCPEADSGRLMRLSVKGLRELASFTALANEELAEEDSQWPSR